VCAGRTCMRACVCVRVCVCVCVCVCVYATTNGSCKTPRTFMDPSQTHADSSTHEPCVRYEPCVVKNTHIHRPGHSARLPIAKFWRFKKSQAHEQHTHTYDRAGGFRIGGQRQMQPEDDLWRWFPRRSCPTPIPKSTKHTHTHINTHPHRFKSRLPEL
jgi:hypothetical protein